MTNDELIAKAREFAGWLEPSEEQTADIIRRLADALEAQSTPLVADSGETLARQMYRIREGVRFISSHDSNRSRQVDEAESDKAYWSWDNGKAGRAMYDTYRDLARDLLASGVVSLAADRDRAVAERALAAVDDTVMGGSNFAEAVREGIRRALRVAYRESEARNG